MRAVADFHTGFNLILAALFLPALGPYAWLLRKLLPARVDADDPSRPRYLDPTALESPPIALGGAAREALRMADALEAMLGRAGEMCWPAPTAAGSARCGGWTTCSTG